jgi:ADP-heptose:LPS heptosyltransferase
MGDILRTVPPVRLVRRALPRARIHWLLEEHWKILLEGDADFDKVVTVPRKQLETWLRSTAGWPRFLGALGALRKRLRALDTDLVLDFHGNLRSGLVGRMSSAAVRVGYDGHQQKEGNRLFTTHRVPSSDRRTPRMERNLDLVRALGLPDTPLLVGRLPMADGGAEQADAIIERFGAKKSHAVISPGASARQIYKKPPGALLVGACRRLAARGTLPLVVFGPGEESDARAVVEAAKGEAMLAPPTRLPTLAALLRGARLFVGGDSGPLHMACAVGCPVVGIYGPTDPQVNQPWGVPYVVVAPPGRRYTGIKRIDRAAGGFDGLRPAHVEAAVDRLLATPAESMQPE